MSIDTRESFYSKHRVEALSDAIFAIVMTLLVLELKVPADVVHGHLWDALRQDGEAWLAFLITFGLGARYWMLQHNVFKLTNDFNHQALILTFIFLGFITILPFSSSLVGRQNSEPLAVAIYCANQAAIGISLVAKLEFLRIRDKLARSASMQHLRQRLYTLTSVMAFAAIFAVVLPFRFITIVPVVIVLLSRIFVLKPDPATL